MTLLTIPPMPEGFQLYLESWVEGSKIRSRVGRNKKGDYIIIHCELLEGKVVTTSAIIPFAAVPSIAAFLTKDLLTELGREREKDAG